MVTCVYVHPQQDRFWLIDDRIYDPQGDGRTKLDHLKDMLSVWVYQKGLPFTGVLMDSGYATKTVMRHREQMQKTYYCPLKPIRVYPRSSAFICGCFLPSLKTNPKQERAHPRERGAGEKEARIARSRDHIPAAEGHGGIAHARHHGDCARHGGAPAHGNQFLVKNGKSRAAKRGEGHDAHKAETRNEPV